MKNVIRKLVCLVIVFSLVAPIDWGQASKAATTPATISVDSLSFAKKFDARDTIEIKFNVKKYDKNCYDYYYCKIMDENGSTVASSSGSVSELSLGTTNLTLFWDSTYEPHKIGKYSVRYYTTHDEGGTEYFYVSTASGKCGPALTWSLNESGTLEVSGTGLMNNFDHSSDQPWYAQDDIISNIVINNGVTSIGKYAFSSISNLLSVSLPGSVRTINYEAFAGCANLTKLTIPEGVERIDDWAFYECTNLNEVTLPISLKYLDSDAFPDSTFSRIIYNGSKTMWKDKKFDEVFEEVEEVVYNLASLKTPSLKKPKSKKRGQVSLTWSKVSGIDGYQIQYDTDYLISSSKIITIKGSSKKSKIFKGLEENERYAFRIRTYKVINGGKNYSAWSAVKKVRVKE